MATIEEIAAVMAKRGITPPVEDTSSVMDTYNKPSSTVDEFKKFMESTFKGSATGLVRMFGGDYGTLYDAVTKNTGTSAFSTKGILDTIKEKTGTDLSNIQGYSGAYNMGQAGVPAAVMAGMFPAMGLLSQTGRVQQAGGTAARLATEGGIAAGTGAVAQAVAPDSPAAQLAIGLSPFAIKGIAGGIKNRMLTPEGTVSPTVQDLQSVGRMTPGEATGSRPQLATEARIEASPKIGNVGTEFRQAQALDAETFLDKLFKKSSNYSIPDPQQTADTLSTTFQNYGKKLSSTLISQASKDFGAAEKSGGMVDSTPIITKVQSLKSTLRPDIPGDAVLSSKLDAILKNLVIEGTPETTAKSLVLSAEGTPATTTTTPAIAPQAAKLPIADLKRSLSEWSKTAYSGEYTLNGSNIFEGVAPGQAKGVARAVLNGYKDALDSAISSGIAGAEQLKAARDNFAKNLRQIDEFADRPIVKAFGKPVTQLIPETDVIPKLMDMPPTQRKLLFSILGDQAPEMADTIRALQFKSVLEAAQAKAPSASAPTFVIDEALKQMNSKKGDFNFLFANSKDATDASKAMQWMRQVLQGEQAQATGGLSGNAAYAGTKALGGTTQAANISKGFAQSIKDILADPASFSKVIFDKEAVNAIIKAQEKSTFQNAFDAMTTVGKAVAKTAVISSRLTSGVTPTIEGQQQQEPTGIPVGVTPSDIEEVMKRRGLL